MRRIHRLASPRDRDIARYEAEHRSSNAGRLRFRDPWNLQPVDWHANALRIPAEYFDEGINRMRDKWLNVNLDGVMHPATTFAKNAAQGQQAAAARLGAL